MKKKYQNIFLVFGLLVLVLMVTQLDFGQVWEGLHHAGYWFGAVLAIWVFLYMLNTASWYIIINSQKEDRPAGNGTKIGFWWLYKITITGFAINYATPGGLMGGEPYRIMELTPKIGSARASASVILYAMTHIFSHFWFWLISALMYVFFRPIDVLVGGLLLATVLFCGLGIWFFLIGYRKGLAHRIMSLLSSLPIVNRRAKPFVMQHQAQLNAIDSQIAALHNQNPRTFVSAVCLELLCRICSSFEILFVLLLVQPDITFLDSMFILSFTSLFANMLFFMPLQLGGREGGFVMSATKLGITNSNGIFLALIVRLRELFWTGLGLLLIKLNNSKKSNDKKG